MGSKSSRTQEPQHSSVGQAELYDQSPARQSNRIACVKPQTEDVSTGVAEVMSKNTTHGHLEHKLTFGVSDVFSTVC